MITDELLNELERLDKAAMAGPWTNKDHARYNGRSGTVKQYVTNVLVCQIPWPEMYNNLDNASLIPAMRNALPDLLAEVRSLRAQLAAIKAAVGPMMEARRGSRMADNYVALFLRAAAISADALEGLLDA